MYLSFNSLSKQSIKAKNYFLKATFFSILAKGVHVVEYSSLENKERWNKINYFQGIISSNVVLILSEYKFYNNLK